MKKALVTKVTKFDKVDSYGNVSFAIEFANGDKGFYSTKSADQTKFVVGKDSEYEITEKQSQKGGVYYKITLPQTEQAFKSSGGKQVQDPKIQFVGFAMRYTVDLIIAGKADVKELPITFEIVYGEMISKL